MRKSIFTLFLGVIFIIAILGGGSKVNKVSIEGRYLKVTGDTHIIINEKSEPIVMVNKSNKKNIFEGLQTGDKIEVTFSGEIRETYPASTDVYSCKLIEKGTIDDINKETLRNLEEMNWEFEY